MTVRARWGRAALLALTLATRTTSDARAHGGAPLPTRLVQSQGRLYLGTQYWGVFVGDGGGWRWLCDEAINGFALHELYGGRDGTLYATDFPGLSVSYDGGCTFASVGGPVAGLLLNGLATDPGAGLERRIYVSGTGEGVSGALYRSDDAGRSFMAVRAADPAEDPSPHLMRGIAVATDGRIHVLVDVGVQQDQPVVYTSRDGGQRFATTVLAPLPKGVEPGRSRILGADPRDPAVVYVALAGDVDQVLLRVDTARGENRELLRVASYIFDVAVDRARDRLQVATVQGLYLGDGAGGLVKSPGIAQAQCLLGSGADLYACAYEYGADQSSLSLSSDGGQSFRRLFRYLDTRGVLECPATTPVAQRCPAVYLGYGSQLGIDVSAPRNPAPTPAPMTPSGCQAAPGAAPAPTGLAALALLLRVRRGWRRRRCGSAGG